MWFFFFLLHFTFYSIACALRIIAIIKGKRRVKKKKKKSCQIHIYNGNWASTIPKRLTGTTKAFINLPFFLKKIKANKKIFCIGLELNNNNLLYWVSRHTTLLLWTVVVVWEFRYVWISYFSEMNLRATQSYITKCAAICYKIKFISVRFQMYRYRGILFI